MARGKGASDQRLLTPLRRATPEIPRHPWRSPEIPGHPRRFPETAGEFQIAHFIFVLSVKTDLDPPLNPPKARHSSGRPWGSLWEGLEELWEAWGQLWEALAELREDLSR